ncbi:hypothetical protein [Kitasatospora sp. NPDC098663]|uniref:hypothetical protein n=1 Tax=Kitasatospora sp. NPDC098663 TaxID=3364096 RepID=UPI0038284F30
MVGESGSSRKQVRPSIRIQQDNPDNEPAEALWMATRSGAQAGRGFHYQDAVGAWLCGRVLSGKLDADRVVPEGLEDLCCEGPTPWHVQVKSRQARIGDFTVADVAGHLLAMAQAHAKRQDAGVTGRSLLVLERPVSGEWFTRWGQPLSSLPHDHPLVRSVKAKALRAGLSTEAINAWLDMVSLYVLPWRVAAEEARATVVQRLGLPPAPAEAVVLALRNAVAGHADANASNSLVEATGLSRTGIECVVTEVAESIDRTSLEEALAEGLCEPVDFDRPLHSDRFYEGVEVQPGHVAAGLPTPRPLLTAQVAEAVARGQSVLVTGPSGVGKSAVMWTAAYSTRHVLWYRIRRLRAEDTAPLVRLAKALKPSSRSPVGFVVDGIGIGTAEAWDILHRELAPLPGVLLLGSVRSEDLLPLRSRAECTQVTVTLDEEVAEQIHAGLSASGATAAPHWREAYDAAGGLTLEFTHLLTRGRRLSDVLSEQVERRVVEGRQTEIEILARISVAHRWGADLPVRSLQQQLGVGDRDFRIALSRLAEEHLVLERMGRLSGLHQLRSGRLVDAVHAVPPPVLDDTVVAVMQMVSDPQLQPFVAGVLADCPDLDSIVLDQAVVELRRRSGASVVTGVLQALRLVDARRCADGWALILDRHRVAPALRRTTLQFSLLDGDPLPMLKPEIASAMAEIRAAGEVGLPLRDALAKQFGADAIGRLLAQCDEPSEAQKLLSVLAGSDLDSEGWSTVVSDSPFGRLLATSPADSLGELLGAARAVSVPLAESLLEVAGGEESVLSRFGAYSPWLTEASVIERDGGPVAYARLLHVSDQAHPEVEQDVGTLGQLLLRCLPRCESVDVQNLLPGGIPLRIGDYTSGISLLPRQNDRSPSQVAWTRTQALIGAAAAGTTDWTTRTATAVAILPALHLYLATLTRVWCTGRGRPQDAAELRATHAMLQAWADSLTLPADTAFLSSLPVGNTVPGSGADHLQLLVDGIAKNLTSRLPESQNDRALASYVWSNLRKQISHVRTAERWHLIGQEPPDVLDQLEETLTDLHAVLAELTWGSLDPKQLRAEARSGPSARALSRAAELARRTANTRAESVPQALRTGALAMGFRAQVYTRPVHDADGAEWPALELAVGVELDDLAEWQVAVEQLCTLLRHDPGSQGFRRAVLLVPLIGGKPVRLVAHQLQSTLWPGTGLFDTWKAALPEAHPTPLADAVVEAHQALQCLSGLIHLVTLRDTDQRHQSIADQAVEQFQRAHHVITHLRPGDPVIGEVAGLLNGLARRVESESDTGVDRRDTEDPNLAVAIARGAITQPTEDFLQLSGLITIAIQWDLDPDRAARILTELDS